MDSTTTVYPHQSLPHLASLSYFAYHSPPHSPYYWPDILQPPQAPPEPDEPQLYPMHHLRFPTPPITPPKTHYKAASATRTHSVIMKVGQGQNLQHLPATLYATTTANSDMNENSNCSTQSSVSSSTSSSTSSPTKQEEEQFLCAWLDCGRLFQNLESLAQHVTQIHAVPSPDNGLYYCRWHGCQRSERGFNARYKMLVHVRTHTKEKPHQCHMCEKSFSRAENLKIHIRSHSGEKPYKCTFEGCQKAYSNSSDRFKHTRTHTMEKPYMCKVPGCQKRYTDPSSLRKHVKTFKHSLQIMEAAATGTQYTQKAERQSVQKVNKMDRFEAMDEDCMSKAAAASYNMHMHLHAEQELAISNGSMPAFYAQHAPTTHWLAEDLVLKSRAYPYTALHSRNYVIDMDMDRPLDLRINRI